eukprot:542689_1
MNSSILLALLFGANIVYSSCLPTGICVTTYQAVEYSWDVPYESYKYMCDGTTKMTIDYNTENCMGNGTSTIIESTDYRYELIDCSGQCEAYVLAKSYEILFNNTNCDGLDSKYYEEELYPVGICLNGWLLGTIITCTDTYVTEKIYWGDVTCGGSPLTYRQYNGCNVDDSGKNRSYFAVEYCGYISKSNSYHTLISFVLLSVVTFIV